MSSALGVDTSTAAALPERISSGVPGLDQILDGGLIARRSYLLRGGPGLGKTTLGLSFLTAAGEGESTLFIGFQEPEAELRANAATVGLDTRGIEFLSLAPTEEFFTGAQTYDVFAASDVEQAPMVDTVIEAVERIQPQRVFIDSLTHLRLLSADRYQFRQQVVSLLRFLIERGATAVFTSESSVENPDDDLQFLADGIITLEAGTSSPTIKVSKLRGSAVLRGRHEYRVDESGVHVFPRTMPPAQRLTEGAGTVQFRSGNATFDKMLHGGFEDGTITLITGPSGIGKSTMAAMTAAAAAHDGYRAGVYQFEEELDGYLQRLRKLDVDVDGALESGRLAVEQIEPLRYLADEFMANLLARVEEEDIALVVIDSVTGFDMALNPNEAVQRPLHILAKSLSRRGVTVLLVNENHAFGEEIQISSRDISHLADNVIFFRYVYGGNRLEKLVGILKKRMSDFEHEQRRFAIAPGGFQIGEPASVTADSEKGGE
ncbi:AAA family ATPase [Halomonas campisalis]|uniref:non-specific serine/threonine protein kinase n=1 Tax=Billgrantia campisalis TaxID=74661 RepID=A0ABS9PDD8_9GAMM|nr:ATPase domain-containing protein [Halomonas campisalis]MCG6659779.1 AAA family ATPase [Halomonas campisalis]MDR5864933.1 ATPase domain-containing protein [Halomonas campisalis]